MTTAMILPSKLGDTAISYFNAKQLFNTATGFMSGFHFTCNPYRGCAYSCNYCYARYFSADMQKIKEWGYWVDVKQNAVELMQSMMPGTLTNKLIYMSSVTDPYQPIERKLNLSRQIIELLGANHKPKLVIQTRSSFISRDIDIFQQLVQNGGKLQINVTITTDHDDIRKKILNRLVQV